MMKFYYTNERRLQDHGAPSGPLMSACWGRRLLDGTQWCQPSRRVAIECMITCAYGHTWGIPQRSFCWPKREHKPPYIVTNIDLVKLLSRKSIATFAALSTGIWDTYIHNLPDQEYVGHSYETGGSHRSIDLQIADEHGNELFLLSWISPTISFANCNLNHHHHHHRTLHHTHPEQQDYVILVINWCLFSFEILPSKVKDYSTEHGDRKIILLYFVKKPIFSIFFLD